MPVIAPAAAVVQAEVSLSRRRERDAAGGGLSWFPTKGRKRAQIGQTDKTMSTDLRFDSSPYQSQSRDGYRPGYKTWYKKSPDVPRVVWHEVRAEARGKSAKNMSAIIRVWYDTTLHESCMSRFAALRGRPTPLTRAEMLSPRSAIAMTAAHATRVHLPIVPTASATARRPPTHERVFAAGSPQALLGAVIGLPAPPAALPHDDDGLILQV